MNIKAIVIGLMDRLSSYAARESESEPLADRQKTEEEATAALLNKLRLSKEKPKGEEEVNKAQTEQTNGEVKDGEQPQEESAITTDKTTAVTEQTKDLNGLENGEDAPRKRGIPENIKLYEVFYEQVTHLVTAQRLQIQDTIALLVSLLNLALYV